MRRFVALIFVISIAGLTVGQEPSPIIKGDIGAKLDRFMRYTAKFPDAYHGTVLVARNGEILLEQGYGNFDAAAKIKMPFDAVMDVASVTKQFTAAAILKLEMQGKLKLEDPLKKYYPSIEEEKNGITLRHLLNHTSGLPNTAKFSEARLDVFDRESVENYIVKLPLASEPGTEWQYNNIAYFLLAAIVEKVSGITWEEYLRENLFEPAGMSDTTGLGEPDLKKSRIPKSTSGTATPFPYGPRNAWAYRGAGGIHSTVHDMFLWDRALRGNKILSAEAKQKYYTTSLNNYALGWNVEIKDGKHKVDHTGSLPGFCCQFTRCLEDDIVIVVLTNMTQPRRGPPEFTNSLMEVLRSGETKVPAETEITLDALNAAQLEGEYELQEGGHAEVKRQGNGIVFGATDALGVRTMRRVNDAPTIGDYRAPILNEKLKEIVKGLQQNDRTNFEKSLASFVELPLREKWAELIFPQDSLGPFKSLTITANYPVNPNITNQFARLDFEKGRRNVLVVWDATHIHAVTIASEYPTSLSFVPADKDGFIAPSKTTWKSPWLQFKRDSQGNVQELTISGFRRPIKAKKS